MYKVNFKRLSLEDINNISQYLSEYNLDAVDKFLNEVERKADILSYFPFAGNRRSDLTGKEFRFIPIAWHYVAAYLISDQEVNILRIYSSKQEFAGLLFE